VSRDIRALWRAVWIGGLVAGTVDIGSACVIFRTTPVIILQAIAGGVLGMPTFDGGWRSAILGLALQWGMSMVIAACCVLASSRIELFARRWMVAGCIYGVVTFFVMNDIVVPLSASRMTPHHTAAWFGKNMLAMLLFGAIISGVASWSIRRQKF
jgi:hypothetical protein